MSTELLGIILDIVVLGCLGATIYYALRLSQSLNNFRAYRKEFDRLIQELNRNIEQAYDALRAMKESNARTSGDLDDMYHKSQKMSEELKLINDTSAALADRLERLALRGRSDPGDEYGAGIVDDTEEEDEFLKNLRHLERDMSDDGFAIHDPEFSGANDEDLEQLSEAEKDLYKALKQQRG